MRGTLVLGSVLAFGLALAGCGGGGSEEKDDPAVTAPSGTPTAAITQTSDSNITPVSSGATTTATVASATATPTASSTAEATNTTTTAAATPTKPAAANTPIPASTQAPQPTPTPTQPAPAGNPLTANVGVSESGSRYLWSPGSVRVAPGGAVTFSWSGGAAHDLSIPQLGFESPATTSATHTIVFPAAGTYSIICVLHPPAMRGTVVVQ